MNLTDKEIIKCAEECVGDVPPCNTCPFDENSIATSECMGEVIKNLIGIINRLQDENEALINGQETLQKTIVEQKVEIERLQNAYKQYAWERDTFSEELKTAKVEVIKEFDERLKEIISDKLDQSANNPDGDNYFITDVYTDLDNLVKELTKQKE